MRYSTKHLSKGKMSTCIKSLQKEFFIIFTKAYFVFCCQPELKLLLNKIEITWEMNCCDTFGLLSILWFLDWNWNMSGRGRGRQGCLLIRWGGEQSEDSEPELLCINEAPYLKPKADSRLKSHSSDSEWVESAGIRATRAAAELLSIILLL